MFVRKLISALICIVAISAWSNGSANSAESIASFWQWFKQNEGYLAQLQGPDDGAIAQLSSKLKSVDERLTFEIGPGTSSIKQLAISADGDISAFASVTGLVASAPKLTHWQVVAFRQRVPSAILNGLQVAGQQAENGRAKAGAATIGVKAGEMRFSLAKTGDKGELVVYIKDYQGDKGQEFMSNIMLQQAIGEYDFAVRLADVKYRPLTDATPKNSKPLVELATDFDALLGPSPAPKSTAAAKPIPVADILTTPPSTINERGTFAVMQGQMEGKNLFLRYNQSVARFAGSAKFPYQAAVGIELKNADQSGMPNPQELNELGAIEEILMRKVNAQNQTLLTFVTTGNAMRTFYFYTGQPDSFRKIVDEVQVAVKDHKFKIAVNEDPEWNTYRAFIPPH
jgi:hypothetical protein